MASPHVAGTAAILKQAKPDWTPEQIKGVLMNTAEKLTDENGKPLPHNTQGAGSIRIMEALKASSIVTPGSHSYGTFLKDKGKQTKNKRSRLKTFLHTEKPISSNTPLKERASRYQERNESWYRPIKQVKQRQSNRQFRENESRHI